MGLLLKLLVMGIVRGRVIAVVGSAVLVGSLLAACADDAPRPLEAAAALAGELNEGEIVSAVSGEASAIEAANHEFAAVVAGMGDVDYTVSPIGVHPDPDDDQRAYALLRWDWALTDTDTWTYETEVQLVRVDGAWRAEWTSAALAPGLAPGERLVARTERDRMRRGAIVGDGGALLMDAEGQLDSMEELARPILGTVGPATAEIIERSDGQVVAGDLTGLSGLQRLYDEWLRGEPGVVIEAVADATARELHRIDPKPGRALRTTLNVSYQMAAEETLVSVDLPSAIVAIRSSDGHVLAAASGPGGQGRSTATMGRFPPGSTFKIVTALALLRAGLDPDSAVECAETFSANGREFRNHSRYPPSRVGPLTLREAIAYSCNTAIVSHFRTVTQPDVAAAARALGLGQAVGLGIPVFEGSVPTSGAGEVEHAAAMIGQGRVELSPVVLANLAASIAAGETVTPRFVLDDILVGRVPAAADEPLTPEEAGHLRTLLRAVVEEGTASFLAELPGEVGAKTGTAEFGTEDPLQSHAWMVAIRGDLAVAVFVEEGGTGSDTAGPLLERFLRAVPPTGTPGDGGELPDL